MSVNIVILGATGAVGREMLAVLSERDFPAGNIRLLSSRRSAGAEMRFRTRKIIVEELTEESVQGADIVFGAVSAELMRRFAKVAAQSGAVVIDNSSAFRMDENVPLVVPEINPGDAFSHSGIIANPNCSTIIALMAVYALHKHSPITRMAASTYQAVSGVGKEGTDELHRQIHDYAAGKEPVSTVFKHPILNNLIPHIDEFTDNGYTAEEMKFTNESRKILHSPRMMISCTCVRVPVMRSHSISLMLEQRDVVSVQLAREILLGAAGVILADDMAKGVYPMPSMSGGKDYVYVGRLRRDISGNGLNLFCCGDQLRKGAATNAVQIAELLVKGKPVNKVEVC